MSEIEDRISRALSQLSFKTGSEVGKLYYPYSSLIINSLDLD